MFDPTPKRLALARKVVARGSPWRGRNDLWFTTDGLIACGGKVAFVFPGVEPVFEPRIDDVARHFGLPPPSLVDSGSAASDLEGLGHSIVGVGRVLDAALVDLGLRADMVAGQSIGEWSGMIATEMIPGDDVDRFIATLEPGSLEVPGVVFAALGCNVSLADELAAGFDGVVVSHDNCPHQTIICGPEASVGSLLEELRRRRIMGQLLPFRSGFHSDMFRPFLEPFRQALARLPLQPPRVPLWSATTCRVYPDEPSSIRNLAAAHLTERVRFRELTLSMHDAGARVFVQVGVGSLPGFVEDTLQGRSFLSIPSNTARRSGLEQLRRVLAATWVEGVEGLRFDRLDPAIRNLRPGKGKRGQPLSLGAPLVQLPRLSDLLTSRPVDEVDAPWATLRAHLRDSSPAGTVGKELGALLADVSSAATDVAAAVAEGSQRDRQGEEDDDPGTRLPRPASSSRQLRLSVETVPSLLDHCFYRQPPGWPSVADRFPVVPMTMLVDLMIDEARRLLPRFCPIAVEDARALQWLAVAPPVEVTVRARVDDPSVNGTTEAAPWTETETETGGRMGDDEQHVHVSIEGYGRATIVMASRYPDALATACPPLADPRPSPVDAANLYEDRWLFHGPSYRGVVELGPMGEDGIDGVVETGSAPGALLDNAGQLMGFWMMISSESDRLALPTSIGRISFYGPPPAVGERFEVAVRVRSLTKEKIRTDMELIRDGQLWARIDGWEDRRFESDERVWPVLIHPEHSLLADIRPAGWVVVTEHWRTSASRELMMRRYLGEREREEYMRQNPRAQRLWLLGRIAAKDAVRRWLFEHGRAACHPVEVSLANDESGRPTVSGPFNADLRVSIAHTQWVAVAQATEGTPVGIDVERLEDRSTGFVEVAFSSQELAVITDGCPEPERGEWLTRGWAAKEAVGKAVGTGLRGRPKDLIVTELKGTRLCVNGMWVDTAREGDAVVAWTVGHES
jgi:phosphopantetheinyl transferase